METESTTSAASEPDTSTDREPPSSPPTPRWVKALGPIVLLLVVVFVVLHFAIGMHH